MSEEPTKTKKIPFPKSVARLSCGHEITYRASPPRSRDTVYCSGCDDYRNVIQITRKGVVVG